MYELTEVRKVFADGSAGLRGVTLAIGRGEQVAFIGPSGAGKTTLFRVLNLTLRPTAGTLRLDGADVAAFSGRQLRRTRCRIGSIYQHHNLVGRLRVLHNVLAGKLGQWSTLKALTSLVHSRHTDLATWALHQVGIPEKLYARTDALSGGQQQRVAIARVLVQDPDVILGDEPISSVDPSLAMSIVTLLRDLSRETGKTLLMNLHSVDLALNHFPRVVGIREGRVQFDLSPAKVCGDVLEELYAGDRTRGREFEDAARRGALVARGCRPLTIAP